MDFDLTSTSHDFVHAELTTCTILVELKFAADLGNNVEFLLRGECALTVYERSDRKNTKTTLKTEYSYGHFLSVVNI